MLTGITVLWIVAVLGGIIYGVFFAPGGKGSKKSAYIDRYNM